MVARLIHTAGLADPGCQSNHTMITPAARPIGVLPIHGKDPAPGGV